jgi:ABC-type transport system substrate-binding protein
VGHQQGSRLCVDKGPRQPRKRLSARCRSCCCIDGPQNHSFWNNPTFDETLLKIDREVDATKRLGHIRAAEKLMEDDPPLLPMAWEKANDAWYNYVKGLKPQEYFGLYDVNRYDVVWLDK